MKNIVIICGSPRKGWNTDTLCKKFAEGAMSVSGEIQATVHYLYPLKYTGCIACMGCKLKSSKQLGHCVVHDGIYDLLEQSWAADGLVLSSPIYFSDVTGQLRSFVERLLFAKMTYNADDPIITENRMLTATIYTMNCPESIVEQVGYDKLFDQFDGFLEHFFTRPQRICAYDTLQVKDYSRYHMTRFSEEEKLAHRASTWEATCREAYEAGASMARKILEQR